MREEIDTAGVIVAQMRRDFDESFALPPVRQAPEVEDILAIRLGGDPYGISIRQLTALAIVERLTPLPSRQRELLGLAGVRGVVVPVYSLAGLLGYGMTGEPSRWIALCRFHDPIALSLGQFEGCLQIPLEELSPADSIEGDRKHVGQTARTKSGARLILDLVSLVDEIVMDARSDSTDE